jgi:hypothetical protein
MGMEIRFGEMNFGGFRGGGIEGIYIGKFSWVDHDS